MRQTAGNSGHNGLLNSTAARCAKAISWNVDDERDDFDQESMHTFSRLDFEKFDGFKNLNASQQLAVEGAITRSIHFSPRTP
jgi:hypothetical protein